VVVLLVRAGAHWLGCVWDGGGTGGTLGDQLIRAQRPPEEGGGAGLDDLPRERGLVERGMRLRGDEPELHGVLVDDP